jgi:hypothetical protein
MLKEERIFHEIYKRFNAGYIIKYRVGLRYYTSRHTGKRYYLINRKGVYVCNIPDLIKSL